MPHLFLFGDSITWGSWDLEGGGWAQRLREEIDKFQINGADFWCPTFNLGIPGDTSAGLLKRIETEIEARQDPDEVPVIMIAIGINDSITIENGISISLTDYHSNLQSIIETARKYTTHVACIGLFPINEKLLTPVPWDSRISYTFARAQAFNQECMKVCQKIKVSFLDLWSPLAKQSYEHLLIDGLHPNSEGHKYIYHEVRKLLVSAEFLVTPFRR